MQKYVPKVTIDHNAIVALHKRDTGASLSAKDLEIATAMDGIIALAQSGDILIILPAIAANERQQKGQEIGNFGDFKARIESLGIKPAVYKMPEFRLGMSYIGYATLGFSGPEWTVLLREIQQIVYPSMNWDNQSEKNWLNRYCDIATMFAHFQANADIFITDDGVFHAAAKNKELLDLGANMIATAKDALVVLTNGTVTQAAPLDLPTFDAQGCTFIPTGIYKHYRAFRQNKGFSTL